MAETSLERALAAIADSAREGPAGNDVDLPVAGTVIVVRDGAEGAEVLMIERPDRGSFAGAWVFPGGKVEASDRDGLAVEATEEDVARRAGVRETLEETGLVVEPVVTLSLWDPPVGAKPRIRTWFFVAPAAGGEVLLAADEAVRSEWVRPRDLLDRHARGEATLYPPTWVTLFSLANAADSGAVIGAARFERFSTAARRGASGPVLLWPDDAEYDAEAAAGAGSRHRLEVGALPWVYTRIPG
jgi:8-oxo-dGTP pyrophosphatase MutT (NUDIX family)